ncbi:metalloregulator ArsR/SmtB family transcription factor [Candidatus Fermentibacteria bacterium]|nr:metalloregulator ArsR/SmtB family transcription factor [Candidatus Fermentibacteria bacterium]
MRIEVSEEELEVLADLYARMSDVTRLKILLELMEGSRCVCELKEFCGVSASAISHQLRLLRAARLVRRRRQGRQVYYRLDDDHVQAVLAVGLEHVREA